MTESKHTPGPWRIGDGGWTVFGPPNGKPAPAVIATLEQGKSMEAPERRANARLIAAAPELLAELQKAMAYMESDSDDDQERQDYATAQSAIAKAAGGEL